MFKKGIDFLARYPRLRVLTFGVGAVVVVGVSMHVFTKNQDLGKTPKGPESKIATQKVTLSHHRAVGDGKSYDKLMNKSKREAYLNKLRHGDTIISADMFGNDSSDKSAKKGSVNSSDKNKTKDQKDEIKEAFSDATNKSQEQQEHSKITNTSKMQQVDENSRKMMSPRDFRKAMLAAERSGVKTKDRMPQIGGNTSLNNYHGNDNLEGGNNLPNNLRMPSHGYNNSNSVPSFHPDRLNAMHHVSYESPQQIQQHKQNVLNLASKMQGQLGQLGSNWNMPVASQVSVDQKAPVDTGSSLTSAQKAAYQLANPKQVIKAATVYFAIIKNKVSSDQPNTPVMAQLITGPYKGSKLLGGFYTEKDKLLIRFNTMVMKSRANSFSLGKAYAIDTKDGQTAVETDVNHHYLLRYGSLFAAAFLEGIGNAYTPTSNYCIPDPTVPGGWNCNGGGNVINPNSVNTKVALMRGAGQVGQTLGQHIGKYFDTPPTVTVAQGTLVGILFMNDVTIPQIKTAQLDPDSTQSSGADLSFLSDDDNS